MVERIRQRDGARVANQAHSPAPAPVDAPAAGAVKGAGPAAAGDAAAVGGGARASGLGLGAPGSDADFVRGLYRSILGREPDPKGFEHHMKLLGKGMSRDDMKAAIMGSQERKNRDAQPDATFVRNLHRELWNHNPSAAEVEEGVRKLREGRTRDDLIRAFLDSPRYQPADTNADRLKPDVADRAPDRAPGAKPAGPGNDGGPGVVRDGPGGFLWKPVSDSTGKLAVLLPPKFSGDAQRAWLVGPDGRKLEDAQDGGVGNGDRQHYRFSKPGGKYPPGTSVVVELANGEQATWKVQNTNARND